MKLLGNLRWRERGFTREQGNNVARGEDHLAREK